MEAKKRQLLLLLPTIGFVIALVVIAVLATKLASPAAGSERTITVTGEATLEETPDEYVFYPTYAFKNADKAAALAELTKKSDEVVAGLKKAGVADSGIKVNSDGYDAPVYYDMGTTDPTYTLRLTVTTKDKALAQKAQDYLLTTTPSGGVSPQVGFSDAKRKSIESKARDQATAEARSKADQTAKNLGFKVGKVQSVSDGSGFGTLNFDTKSVAPSRGAVAMDAAQPELAVQPGLNDVTYSVTVVYEIR